MNRAITLELRSTFVELEEILKLRPSNTVANPLVYFLDQLPVTSRCRQRHDLFQYSGEISLLTVRTASVLRDPSLDLVTLESMMTNIYKLQVHEERLNTAIDAEYATLLDSSKRQTLIELQAERRDRLRVIALLLAQVSLASQKVEQHYLKSAIFRKGPPRMQEAYSLVEQLPELTEARNEVFLRPSQEALENYLRHAEAVPTLRDVKELFNGGVGLTQADLTDYVAGLTRLQDELHVAVLVSGV